MSVLGINGRMLVVSVCRGEFSGGGCEIHYAGLSQSQYCLSLVLAAQHLPKLQPGRESSSATSLTNVRKSSSEGLEMF